MCYNSRMHPLVFFSQKATEPIPRRSRVLLVSHMPLYDSRCRADEATVKVETGQYPLEPVREAQVDQVGLTFCLGLALASKRRVRPAKRNCTVACLHCPGSLQLSTPSSAVAIATLFCAGRRAPLPVNFYSSSQSMSQMYTS